jgi:type II secretion system protein I
MRFSKTSTLTESGFTLLEVVIAMAIMLIAFASILSVESGAINATARAKQLNIVAMLARNKMVETEYKFEGKTFDEVKKDDGGAFEAPYQDFRWTAKIKEIKFPNLNIGGGGDKGGDKGGGTDMVATLTKLLTKFLSKAMREVTVTIFYKRGSGEQSFAVSTYWVDLNHEFETSE